MMLALPNLPAQRSPSDALLSLVDTCDSLGAAFFAGARRTLESLLADPELLDSRSPVDPIACSRDLLWRDPMNRFGIWVLWWPPGSGTPIHNHHCSCAFGVYRGHIEEILYTVQQDGNGTAEQQRCLRGIGYVGGGTSTRTVHRMRNPTGQLAASIHLYAYHPELHPNSIERSFPEPACQA